MKKVILVTAFITIGITLIACKEVDYCTDETMAYVMGQNFVKKRLKNPNSAEFPTVNGREGIGGISIGECKFLTGGYVDAANSFGGNVRIKYTTIVEYDKSTKLWKLIKIDIKE